MANAIPRIDNLRYRIERAREHLETRSLLSEFLNMPENRMFPLFGVTSWAPHEVHSLKDLCFLGMITALVKQGWNCDMASFGEGHRDTLLMEMARRGFPKSVTRLLDMGAEADHNTQGYGASTPMMCTRDPEIMKKLLYYGSNPLATNALGQTDFTYKLFKGMTSGARFYLYNTEKIPFQSLLANYRDCILSHASYPYEPMYPLCLVPVVPNDAAYKNIIDKQLINSMLRGRFLPFSSKALLYPLEENLTVWRHIRFHLQENLTAAPELAVACMACMAKLEECRTLEDFAFLESYIEKPLPRDPTPRENFSKAIFVYLLFSLSALPSAQLLRWLILIGKLLQKVTLWTNALGEEPFRVVNSILSPDGRSAEGRDTHLLQELATLQALLAMRVNVSDNFGEFHIPEEFTGLLAMRDGVE